MKLSRYTFLILPVLILTTMPLAAGTWVESSQADFADGTYNANVFASDDGSDGSVKTNPGQVYDLNKDSYPDLVVSNFWNGGNFDCMSYIYWGSATGYTTANRTELLTHGATANAVADLNRDGNLDIVFCSYQNGLHKGSTDVNSLIYWGSKTGFHAGDTTGLPTMGAHSVYIADLNHDGHLDIVFANMQSNGNVDVPSYIYWGSHDGYSAARRTALPTRCAMGVSVADLDKDGRLDLVFSSTRTNVGAQPDIFDTYSYIYYGQGTDSIWYDTAHRDSVHTHGAYGNAIADLNHDGWLDLVFCNNRTEASYNIHSYIYYGSAGGFSTAHMDSLLTHGTAACGIADLNKDGHDDIVFANGEIGFGTACDTSYIYWGSDSGFTDGDRFDLPIYSGASVIIGKLNNDGYLDLMMDRGLDQGYSYIFYGSQDGFSLADRDSVYTTRGHVSTKDIGNVHDRSLTESYCSSVFGDGATTYRWGACGWDSNLPEGAGLQVALRVGDSPDPDDGSWTAWMPVAFAGAKAGLPDAKHAQYRILATANGLLEGPALNQLSLDYTPLTGTGPATGQPAANGAVIRCDLHGAVISCQLAGSQAVRFAIYNLQGQLVATLASGVHQSGQLVLVWNGSDNAGRRVASGVYLCDGAIGPDRYHARVLVVR